MIEVFTTGGTIEGLEYEIEENNSHESLVSIDDFYRSANLCQPCKIQKVFSKDSRSITEEDRNLLVKKIMTSKSGKILITHGTLTMIETARFLGKLYLDKTIVLVGSFVLGSKKNTDAPFNLGYATCAIQFLNKGVYVAMNGGIISWKNVVKTPAKDQFMKKFQNV